jgi:hypothetical protein
MGDFHPLNASHTEHTRRNRLSYLMVARLAKNLSGIAQECVRHSSGGESRVRSVPEIPKIHNYFSPAPAAVSINQIISGEEI